MEGPDSQGQVPGQLSSGIKKAQFQGGLLLPPSPPTEVVSLSPGAAPAPGPRGGGGCWPHGDSRVLGWSDFRVDFCLLAVTPWSPGKVGPEPPEPPEPQEGEG